MTLLAVVKCGGCEYAIEVKAEGDTLQLPEGQLALGSPEPLTELLIGGLTLRVEHPAPAQAHTIVYDSAGHLPPSGIPPSERPATIDFG